MIWYGGNVSYNEFLTADLYAGILFGALKIRIRISEGKSSDAGLYLLGYRIKDYNSRIRGDRPNGYSGRINDGDSTEDTERQEGPAPDVKEPRMAGAEGSEPDVTVHEVHRKASFSKIMSIASRITGDSCGKLRSKIKNFVIFLIRQGKSVRLEGNVTIGFEDPYYTGKVLEVLSLIYAGMGDSLRVVPVWDRYCLSGELGFTGRIWTVPALNRVVGILRDPEFRKIRREYNDWRV